MKIRILRGTTIADPPVFEPGKGDPPTFAPGDVVDVGDNRALAQLLVGSEKAEYVSGEPLVEPAPYEEEEKEEEKREAEQEEKAVETASVAPAETAMKPRAPARKVAAPRRKARK